MEDKKIQKVLKKLEKKPGYYNKIKDESIKNNFYVILNMSKNDASILGNLSEKDKNNPELIVQLLGSVSDIWKKRELWKYVGDDLKNNMAFMLEQFKNSPIDSLDYAENKLKGDPLYWANLYNICHGDKEHEKLDYLIEGKNAEFFAKLILNVNNPGIIRAKMPREIYDNEQVMLKFAKTPTRRAVSITYASPRLMNNKQFVLDYFDALTKNEIMKNYGDRSFILKETRFNLNNAEIAAELLKMAKEQKIEGVRMNVSQDVLKSKEFIKSFINNSHYIESQDMLKILKNLIEYTKNIDSEVMTNEKQIISSVIKEYISREAEYIREQVSLIHDLATTRDFNLRYKQNISDEFADVKADIELCKYIAENLGFSKELETKSVKKR